MGSTEGKGILVVLMLLMSGPLSALASSPTDLSTELTTVTLSPATIFANNVQTAVLTVQVFNQVGSAMSGASVSLSTGFSGLAITPSATTTDTAGRASFSIRAYTPGIATLQPTAGGQALRMPLLTVVGVPTSGAGTSSAGIPSAAISSIAISPFIASSNGTQTATFVVTAKDAAGNSLMGKLTYPRATSQGISFSPISALTDAGGIATFSVTRTIMDAVTFTAVIDTVGVVGPTFRSGTSIPTAQPSSGSLGGSPGGSPVGTLVKLEVGGDPLTPTSTTVYFADAYGRRHAFPNEKIYATWYPDFSQVRTITASALARLPLGSNVTFRPGTVLAKFPSSPRVYAISGPHTLRWIASSDIAARLFGPNWERNMRDLPEALAPSYVFGTNIAQTGDYSAAQELSRASSIDDVLTDAIIGSP